ncbi:MAG: ABC transporter substrate-binding protein [Flavobacteriales bacterium]|nr:ABC transporter substrate-binding protein [Flavobacteriales bacterium]
MKKILICIKIGFFFIFIIIGCAKKEKRHFAIFRYNDASGITSLDPAYASSLSNIWAVQQLYNGLVQLDSSLQIQPCLAHSWEVSEDGMKYIFYLRRDVLFHPCPCFSGKRYFKASDVVFTFQRLVNTGSGSWITNYLANNSKSGLPQVIAINDSVVQFELSTPFVQFIQVLATPYAMIVPPEAVAYYGKDFGFHPVGTGPFVFRKWWLNEKLVLNKNPDYFEWEGDQRLPYLDGVTVTFLKDPQVAMLDFIRGKLDFLSGMEQAYQQELIDKEGELKEKYKHEIQLLKVPYLNTEYIGFYLGNTTTAIPLSVRKALQAVLNREIITRYVKKGVGIPAESGFVPPSLRTYNQLLNETEYDDRVKELNIMGKQSMDVYSEFTLYADPLYTEIYTQVVNQWKKAGFKVKLEIMDRPTLKSQVAKGQLGCFRGSWIGDFADPINYYSVFYSKNWSPAGPNYTHFYSLSFDSLYQEAMQARNVSQRIQLYQQMDSILRAELPVIPLYYDEVVRFIRKDVTGLGINGMNNLDLKRVKKKHLK